VGIFGTTQGTCTRIKEMKACHMPLDIEKYYKENMSNMAGKKYEINL